MKSKPNILLFITDQQRGDCLGIEGHPVVQTPYIDQVGAEGVHFTRAYTECPVCIPARRSLMTGQRPAHHGVLMNYNTRLDGPTLPGELAGAGYQTHLVGKLHLWPARKLYGFMSADWSDGPHHCGGTDDYARFLRREGVTAPMAAMAGGQNVNGWVARPWHLDERLHFSNWCADQALEFLDRRDPTLPFFLKVSFLHPHQPCSPPRDYYERYMDMELPEPYVGDWARVFDGPQRGLPIASWRTALDPRVMRQYRAGYYGSINHIDDQIGRILNHAPRDTIVIFTSDHGEMLGDHQWIRKRNAFEPSARIPLVMRFPQSMDVPARQVRTEPVQLMDIMPTLLDAVGASIPGTVDGTSLMPLLRGKGAWREYLHGECADVPSLNSGMQYLTDGKRKYIWYPGPGTEQFFDLENDPREMHDLARDGDRQDEITAWRERLIEQIDGRPESFVQNGALATLGSNTPFCMPGYEQHGGAGQI
jgi:choline-sulfatase